MTHRHPALPWVRRAGRRGSFLLFLAVLDLLIGYDLYFTAAPQRLLNLLAPYQTWAFIWVAVGVVCAVQAFMRADRLAFTAAAGIKFAWGALSVQQWLIQGDTRGWVSAIIWLTFAAAVFVVSGWPEPPPPPLPPTLLL
jgi:hypothetical protein